MKNTFVELVENSLLALILLTVVSVFSSCGGDDNGDPEPQQPAITSIEPAKGEVGDVVTIIGINFSATASGNKVSFNGVEASITSSTATEIKTVVPASATTGKVTVTVEGVDPVSSTSDFTVFDCSALTLTLASGGYSIEAEVSGGTAPYEYALDNGSFQSESNFDVDAIDHTVKVKDANGCEATSSISAATLKTYTDQRDEQTYSVVKIGDQVWLGQNFNLNTNTADSTSSWCPEDVAANCETYGRLYTWYVASEMAPEGWRLPTKDDWETLFEEVGGKSAAGDALVEAPFLALEAGFRLANGSFGSPGTFGDFWSSSIDEDNPTKGVYYELSSPGVYQYSAEKTEVGFSVRLIKN